MTKRIDNGAISRDYFDEQVLCIKQDRVTELRRLTTSDVRYEKSHCTKQDKNNLYVFLEGGRVFIVPNSVFESEDKRQEIAQFINSKL